MRAVFIFIATALFFSLPVAEAASVMETASAVQITLYDLAKDARSPAATGRAKLLPHEQKAKLYIASKDATVARLPHQRDEFYITRLASDPQTGKVTFRVRYQQIVGKNCTAVEVKDYAGVSPGEARELFSARARIRAVLKVV